MYTMQNRNNLSTLSLAILGLVSQKPMSGYDLRKVFTTTPMGHFSSSPGAIYPALKRLEADNLITGEIENKNVLRPKRVYTLTQVGTERLVQRLAEPITSEDIIWRMDDLILRFPFIWNTLGQEKTLHFLKMLLQQIEAYIPSLQEYLDNMKNESSPYGVFAMQHGIEMYQAHARWARRVIDQLQDKS